MIVKMEQSMFESMLPLTVESLSSSPLINSHLGNYPPSISEEDDRGLFSYDQWKKFELDFPELLNIEDIFDENYTNDWRMASVDTKYCLFLNHDCMWAGHCGSKEHAEEPKPSLSGFIPTPPVIKKEPCPPLPSACKVVNGQQSLLKTSVKAAMGSPMTLIPPSIPLESSSNSNITQRTPLTPPESDDEENKANTTTLLKILNEAINECDLDEDSDLTAYFEGKEIKEEPSISIKEEALDIKEEPEDTESDERDEIDYQQFRIRTQWAAENDHSYHKDKNAAMQQNDYGLDTPSDSEEEEEIDVVSVTDKITAASRMELSMPTNPSSRDKHQLQRRVATAMSKAHNTSGIKTILPVRNADGATNSTSATGRRGVKRGRGTRTNNGYKRRRTNIDAEREPTDKRHLHNDMERQRRVDLRIAFENLKSVVPEVSGTKKIAKVNILLQAAQYCYYLTGANMNYTKQHDDLRRKQIWLRSRVSQLRKNLAARR